VLLSSREIIHQVERSENLKSRAVLLSGLVEWQHTDRAGAMAPFDMFTNLQLEEALEAQQGSLKVSILHQEFTAQVAARRAVSANGHLVVELHRKEIKGGRGV